MFVTDRQLKAIHQAANYDGQRYLSLGNGFTVEISPKAKIVFQYRVRVDGKSKRIAIGTYPSTTLKKARQIHEEMVLLKDRGKDPLIALHGEHNTTTLDDCVHYWLDKRVKHLKPNTRTLYETYASKYFLGAFPHKPVEQITAKEWMAWFDELAEDNPKMANSCFSKMRACLNFCKSKLFIESTKLEVIRQKNIGTPSEKGDRVLLWHELAQVYRQIESSKAGASIKSLLILTLLWGNRISELRLAKHEHFDLERDIWVVPKELSKTGKPIRRPIPAMVKPILERQLMLYTDYVFEGGVRKKPVTISAANRFIRRQRDCMKLEHWRTHDFRRSLATNCSELGVLPHVVEKMLGHELGGVLAVYNKHDWFAEQNQAYEAYHQRLKQELVALSRCA